MDQLNIDEIEEGQARNIEIWVAGSRRITISITKRGTSVQMPHSEISVSQSEGSFYAKTALR